MPVTDLPLLLCLVAVDCATAAAPCLNNLVDTAVAQLRSLFLLRFSLVTFARIFVLKVIPPGKLTFVLVPMAPQRESTNSVGCVVIPLAAVV